MCTHNQTHFLFSYCDKQKVVCEQIVKASTYKIISKIETTETCAHELMWSPYPHIKKNALINMYTVYFCNRTESIY